MRDLKVCATCERVYIDSEWVELKTKDVNELCEEGFDVTYVNCEDCTP